MRRMKSRKIKTIHRCSACALETSKWTGRCPGCEAWQTLEEVTTGGDAHDLRARATAAKNAAPRPARGRTAVMERGPERAPALTAEQLEERVHALDVSYLGEVAVALAGERMPTGLREVDRVLGGGLTPGAATILGGDPGIGKSTLVLQLAYALASAGRRVLYVSGEENPAQLRLRAERLGFLPSCDAAARETRGRASVDGRAPLLVLGAVELEKVLDAFELAPELVIVDSMQVLRTPTNDAGVGSVSQVRDVAHILVDVAKARNAALLLVGHVTKEGSLAGPRVVEHLVDQVLALEGEAGSSLRILRASKNRFGDATETGVLEMTARGLVDVENPSLTFLAGRAKNVSGSCVLATREGTRSYLVEVQALATERAFATPTRRVTGLDAGRVAQVIAVLEKRGGLVFREQDLFVSVTAGARVREPGGDLTIAVACASSLLGRRVRDDTVFFGEIGLGGEVRAVPGFKARLSEAVRLGFRHAMIPDTDDLTDIPTGLETTRVTRVEEVLKKALD
jgi:DNA repair protein RadA/Sms